MRSPVFFPRKSFTSSTNMRDLLRVSVKGQQKRSNPLHLKNAAVKRLASFSTANAGWLKDKNSADRHVGNVPPQSNAAAQPIQVFLHRSPGEAVKIQPRQRSLHMPL